MAELPRLNGIIRALESGGHALTCFSPAEISSAVAMSSIEIRRLRVRDGASAVGRPAPSRIACNTMLNRAQIAKAASAVPGVTPLARDPRQWRGNGAMARQAGPRHRLLRHRVPAHFDGRGRPPMRSALAAIRGLQKRRAHYQARRHPRRRPDHGGAMCQGLTQQEYYQEKADVWPLNPQGEIFCILQIEDTKGVERSRRHTGESARRRRHPDRRRRPLAGARLSAA